MNNQERNDILKENEKLKGKWDDQFRSVPQIFRRENDEQKHKISDVEFDKIFKTSNLSESKADFGFIPTEEKEHFLHAENDCSSESDSESEKEVVFKPTKVQKKSKTNNKIDMMLMEQLVEQQKDNLKAQKKIFKLKNEIDKNEVHDRYLKLDLNNANLKVEELNATCSMYQKRFGASIMLNFLFLFLAFALGLKNVF